MLAPSATYVNIRMYNKYLFCFLFSGTGGVLKLQNVGFFITESRAWLVNVFIVGNIIVDIYN